jgi:hypothetical protein
MLKQEKEAVKARRSIVFAETLKAALGRFGNPFQVRIGPSIVQ